MTVDDIMELIPPVVYAVATYGLADWLVFPYIFG